MLSKWSVRQVRIPIIRSNFYLYAMDPWRKLFTVGVLVWGCPGFAQEPCEAGTLFEPYSQVCAAINDRRDWWLTPSEAGVDEPPEAGAINVGMTYLDGLLTVNTSGRFHTKMFVYPEGLSPSGFLGWTFTPATNRVDSAVEVVGIYRTALGDSGVLSIFGRPCTVEYPCPDGDTSNGWQPSKYFSELECNITQIVDGGGHAQKIVHYANHSDRLDTANPPLWKNAVYLWNYCADEWDLVWEHTYREQKRDCSVEGCYWWGPGIELSGDPFPRPQVSELGYEDTLLFHDGVWSELRPNETGFRNPEDRPDLSPWQLFHLDPNRSFGVGSFVNDNDPPVIESQELLTVPEDQSLELSTEVIQVSDPDVDPAYHAAFALTVHEGTNYTRDGLTITPIPDYFGLLSVPSSVSDGAAVSPTFELQIEVTSINDAPVITGQSDVETRERTPVSITLSDVTVSDPDNELSELTLSVLDGVDFQRSGNTITPSLGVTGQIFIPVTVSDAESTGPPFELVATVTPDTVVPVITLLGNSSVSLFVGDVFRDSGATAADDLDGDITGRIIIRSSVDTSTPGSYAVIYSVSDLAGNEAAPVTRTVTVHVRTTSSGAGGSGCFIATQRHKRRMGGATLGPHESKASTRRPPLVLFCEPRP